MISVKEAEEIILNNAGSYGAEIVLFDNAVGRVLAEIIKADRDMPPFDRVTMDGIAVRHDALSAGQQEFHIIGTQAAGEEPLRLNQDGDCIEVMTGAALPEGADTIIRYEDVTIEDGKAIINVNYFNKSHFIHIKGADRKAGEVLAVPGQKITPALLSLITSVGEEEIRVAKLPRVAIFSTGDELVDVRDTPGPYQIRKSNSYTVQAILAGLGMQSTVSHLKDDKDDIRAKLGQGLAYNDVIILTGGVSAGKFDYLPQVLPELGIEEIFHKVAQRPGKPFWFGKHDNGVKVFAFPGNPVSVFTCMHRYFIPWLYAALGSTQPAPVYAQLDADLEFVPQLTYFLQVKLQFGSDARLLAEPLAGNGSGDFANLADADALMELPADKKIFKKGEVYRIYLLPM